MAQFSGSVKSLFFDLPPELLLKILKRFAGEILLFGTNA